MRSIAVRGRSHARMRPIVLWAALAIALLSSVMTGGLPRSTSHGSAFNPATTAVALKPTRIALRDSPNVVRLDDVPDPLREGAVHFDEISALYSAAQLRVPAALLSGVDAEYLVAPLTLVPFISWTSSRGPPRG